jgi:hypothetical protein
LCGGSGKTAVTSCPKKLVTSDIWELIDLAYFAKQGAWPVTGGILDQSASFLDACKVYWSSLKACGQQSEES